MKLQGKWALVTGSSRGVGQHVAIGLASYGCNIVVHGRTENHCARTIERLTDMGVDCFAAPGTLGVPQEESLVIEAVKAGCPQLDILYNNAGILNPWKNSIFDIPMDDWSGIFEVNLWSLIRLCNVFVPGMVERGWGRIVNVTSGIKDQPQLSPYSVSKAAVDKYTQDLAAELRGTGVIVNTMDPGWLRTDLGGPNADHEVSTVLPGALVPVLLDEHADSGRMFSAQDYRCLGE
jgi:NAD(P)-dependent dehydrogenase (short-subunit alcohol dehydrogenase family)